MNLVLEYKRVSHNRYKLIFTIVKVACHNHVKLNSWHGYHDVIVTNALSMLMIFTKLNDLCLCLYYAVHVGNLGRIIWLPLCCPSNSMI